LTGPIARRSSKARIRSGELFGEISATASPCSVKITRRAPCKTGRRTFRVCRRNWVRVASTFANYTLYILLQLDPFVRTLFPVCYLLSPRPLAGRRLDNLIYRNTLYCMLSVTTSIRLKPDLRQKLDRAARRSGLGRNTLVVRALHRFLDPDSRESLAEEARRQSLAACRQDPDWDRTAESDPWPAPVPRKQK